MCHSGTCYFEDNMGNCRVKNTIIYAEEMKYHACHVGGYEGEVFEKELDADKQLELLRESYKKGLLR